MLYIDTSILVAALTREAETARVQKWLASQVAGDLSISEWVATEFSAVLSIKLRTAQLEPAQRAISLAAFARLRKDSLEILPIQSAHFRTAAHFADQYSLGLRAGDALHLAVASELGATILSLDQKLVAAGAALGVSARLL